MNVLMVHNYYLEPGGEDRSFAAEAEVLEEHGHAVTRYTVDNAEIESMTRLGVAKRTLWNAQSYRQLRAVFGGGRFDVAHFQNTFPLISPAAYYAAQRSGVPVVQTLHNYRLSCVSAYHFRDGRVCEDCLGKAMPLLGAVRGCYRGSRPASAVVAGMIGYHKLRRTFHRQVDAYIALSEFSKAKAVEAGLPGGKIHVKPNFVSPDPGEGAGEGSFALFVGRLSEEKGVRTLLSAWARIGDRLPLKVIGDGPLAPLVQGAPGQGVERLGQVTPGEVLEAMGQAAVVVFPSEGYETFGRVVIEAFSKGTPVIASDLGSAAELVSHGRTGLLFRPGDAEGLEAAVTWAVEHPDGMAAMRKAARQEYETKYSGERNYAMLLAIYRGAMAAQERRAR